MSFLTRLASGNRADRANRTTGVRAPLVATQNVQYTGRGLPQVPNWDARSAVEQGYLGHPAVYSAVRTIAETVSSLPFRAGRDPSKPGEHDPNAPLARLLGPAPGGPNPTTSSRALWAWSIAQRIVTGRMGWELERAPRTQKVVNVWPLVSQYLQPIPTVALPGQTQPTTYFAQYRYLLPDGFVDLPANKVFYSWRPSQSDWRQPETVMQAARIPISIAIALNRYHWGMLNNGMAGRKLIVTPPFAEEEQRRAWQEQFLAEMTGFDNAGKPAFGEATADFDPVTGKAGPPSVQVVDLAQTATDAQLMALMDYVESAIYKAFSVPESQIGDASHRTYSNASEEYRTYWTRTILPLCTEIADDVNTFLAPQLGDEVGWFDLSNVDALKPQKLFAAIAPDNALKAGMIVPGEWRRDVGLPWDLPTDASVEELEPAPAVDDPEIAESSSSGSSGGRRAVDVRHDVIDRITAITERRAAQKVAGHRYDTSPIGLGKNWVTSVGGLPLFARAIAHALMRDGHSESEAIQLAIGVIQNWASGRGKVTAKTQAKASAALAEWNAKKAASHAKTAASRDAAPVATESGSAGLLLPKGPVVAPKPRRAHVFKPGRNNRRKCATCNAGVTAAAHLHTGRRSVPDIGPSAAMVALYPPAGAAKKIAVPGGLPASDLHVTLAYLGKDLTPAQVETARTVVAAVAKEHTPLSGSVGGLGQFPAGDDGVPHYAPVDVPNLAEMRDRLVQRLTDAGVPVAVDHGFTPHMTLTYLKDGTEPPQPVKATKVSFGALVVKHGAETTTAPFEGARSTDILDRIAGLTGGRHRGPHLPVVGGHANTPARKREAVLRLTERHVGTVENQLADALRRLFTDQKTATVSRMNGNRGKQMIRAALRTADATPSDNAHEPTPLIDPGHIFDQQFWEQKTADTIRPVLASIGSWVPGHFTVHVPDAADTDDSAAVQSVQDYLSNATNRIAGQITQETFQQLTQALIDGVVAGDGYPGLASRVQQVFDQADQVRAETIARTETHAATMASADAYSSNLPAGIVGARKWLATPDSRTRPAHAAAEGQTRPLGEPFTVGEAELMFPGDPSGPPDQIINCRCVLVYEPA